MHRWGGMLGLFSCDFLKLTYMALLNAIGMDRHLQTAFTVVCAVHQPLLGAIGTVVLSPYLRGSYAAWDVCTVTSPGCLDFKSSIFQLL